jgi:hypothetical protein
MHDGRGWYSTVADIALFATCRIGYSMIDSAEKEGKITPGKVSSNSGFRLCNSRDVLWLQSACIPNMSWLWCAQVLL